MTTHELKIDPELLEEILSGKKRHEVRDSNESRRFAAQKTIADLLKMMGKYADLENNVSKAQFLLKE